MTPKRRVLRGRIAATINITPLIDILLVLLVIFMTASSGPPPKPAAGHDVAVPQPIINPPKNTESPLIVSVDGAGVVRIDAAAVDGMLTPHLRQILSTRHDRTVFVAADSSLAFETIAKVIDESRGAGAARVGLMTEVAGVMK